MVKNWEIYPKAPSEIVFTMLKSFMVGIPLTGSGDELVRGDRSNLGESVLKSLGDSLIALSAFFKALILSLI